VAQGISVLLVEQDVSQALAVATRVHCLLEGKTSLTGTPDQLSADPSNRRTSDDSFGRDTGGVRVIWLNVIVSACSWGLLRALRLWSVLDVRRHEDHQSRHGDMAVVAGYTAVFLVPNSTA